MSVESSTGMLQEVSDLINRPVVRLLVIAPVILQKTAFSGKIFIFFTPNRFA